MDQVGRKLPRLDVGGCGRFGHRDFLSSDVGATSGEKFRLGESCGETGSSSSVIPEMVPLGLERPERAVASANSFRRASSSFSNL